MQRSPAEGRTSVEVAKRERASPPARAAEQAGLRDELPRWRALPGCYTLASGALHLRERFTHNSRKPNPTYASRKTARDLQGCWLMAAHSDNSFSESRTFFCETCQECAKLFLGAEKCSGFLSGLWDFIHLRSSLPLPLLPQPPLP